jgi:hypothetical protein
VTKPLPSPLLFLAVSLQLYLSPSPPALDGIAMERRTPTALARTDARGPIHIRPASQASRELVTPAAIAARVVINPTTMPR